MRRSTVSCAAAVLAVTLLPGASPTTAAVAPPDRPFPARIELPDGFQPEGIAVGPGATAWLGSLADGDIYRVSLRTGEGSVAFEGPGTSAVGLKRDGSGRLYIAGGRSGTARVLDTSSGAVTSYALGGAFVNDVVLTREAAWFTDSGLPRLYRLDRGEGGAGVLPAGERADDAQVRAGGHRQELGEPLDDAEDDGLEPAHGRSAPSAMRSGIGRSRGRRTGGATTGHVG